MKIALITNSKARQTDAQSLARLYTALNNAGIEYLEFIEDDKLTMSEFADAAAKDGFEVVVAVGGDGTISTVATKLVGTNTTLGVIPMGTYNNFAKDLNIPEDIEGAVANLINGSVVEIDVGEVNGHHFINNSSIGLYPHLVLRRERSEARGVPRILATTFALLKIFQKFPYHKLKLSLDGTDVYRETPMLFIGNGRYNYHGLDIGERRLPIDGKMSLFVLKDLQRFDLAKFSLKVLSDNIHGDPNFENYHVEEAVIELPKKLIYVSKDGEVLRMESPLRYKVVPKALKVIIPK